MQTETEDFMNTIRQLEELSLNAWPAIQTLFYDGWALRFANGYTRRANSVNPLYRSMLDITEKVAHCEAFYASRQQPTVFKLTDAADPPELDAMLEALGYTAQAPTSVQTVALAEVEPPSLGSVQVAYNLNDRWFDLYCAFNNVAEVYRPTLYHMLALIVPRCCFMTLLSEGEPAAVGLGVAEGAHVGLFDLVTAEAYRSQGLGRQLVLNLLAWGRDQGAHFGYLQVMQENTPALRLYESIGFREAHHYWYRVKSD